MIDLRTLRPIDLDTVLESVARTNRLLAVEEGPRTGGWASGLLGRVAEHGLHDLDDAWLLDHRRAADSLQPDARGRVHPRRRGDRRRRARARGNRGELTCPRS